MRVALRRREIRVACERLNSGRRSAAAEEARHEEVSEVVKAPAFEPGAFARAVEDLAEAPLAPRFTLSSDRHESVGILLPARRQLSKENVVERNESLVARLRRGEEASAATQSNGERACSKINVLPTKGANFTRAESRVGGEEKRSSMRR